MGSVNDAVDTVAGASLVTGSGALAAAAARVLARCNAMPQAVPAIAGAGREREPARERYREG